MENYKLIKDLMSNEINNVKRISDDTFIPMVEDNKDYQAYLKWLDEGNEPLPADE